MSLGAFRISLPATSANLGAAFDSAAVALGMHLEIEASISDAGFSIEASGRDAELCSKLEDNLILETYSSLLKRKGAEVVPLALTMKNGIPLGMGCGSSAAGRLAAIALAVNFGGLGWDSERILEEACRLEGHPDNAAACWLGGMVVASELEGHVHVARVEPPVEWRAMVVMPGHALATSKARAVLPDTYSRADAVANIQAAALLGLAFAQGRGELLRAAMSDRIHQPYRAEICALLPLLLPLAGENGIFGVALSGAGPSVLLILAENELSEGAYFAVREALGGASDGSLGAGQNCEILMLPFAVSGGSDGWGESV